MIAGQDKLAAKIRTPIRIYLEIFSGDLWQTGDIELGQHLIERRVKSPDYAPRGTSSQAKTPVPCIVLGPTRVFMTNMLRTISGSNRSKYREYAGKDMSSLLCGGCKRDAFPGGRRLLRPCGSVSTASRCRPSGSRFNIGAHVSWHIRGTSTSDGRLGG